MRSCSTSGWTGSASDDHPPSSTAGPGRPFLPVPGGTSEDGTMSSRRPTAQELRERLSVELEPLAARPRFLELLKERKVPRERLTWLAGEQYHIISSDQRSFSLLAARFPEPPAGELFLDLAKGEAQALRLLVPYAAALGWTEDDLPTYQPKPLAQAYPHFLAWCALSGTRSAVALAMAANLRIWGSYCATTAAALQSGYGLTADSVEFFRWFAEPPEGFEDAALAVVQAGLDAGDDPEAALRAGHMMHAYELAFWKALGEGL
ncbi:MAG: transcriptional regulator [Streptosporangiales bacterium]|nr:transcriptional regulator [Streptosporangiales bacterium]